MELFKVAMSNLVSNAFALELIQIILPLVHHPVSAKLDQKLKREDYNSVIRYQ